MKNKKLIYVLGLLVVVVWGGIFAKIIDAVGDDDQVALSPVPHLSDHDSVNDFSIKRDTTRLLLNYDDPFRLAGSRRKPEPELRRLEPPRPVIAPAPPRPAFTWDFVKYSGYFSTPGTKKLTAVMVINGRSVMLQEGESANEVKMIKNFQDSVKVTFKGRTGYIRMQ